MRNISEPMIIGGDFNTILWLDERAGGNGCLFTDSLEFGAWIDNLSLIDMGFKGSKFTWKRGCEERNFVAKRLDRVLCCANGRLKWQEPTCTHSPFLSSDYAPLFLQLCPVVKGDPRRRPFWFEAAWLKHESFKDHLDASWKNDISTPEALHILWVKLKRWNAEVFGDVQRKKDKTVEEL
ncbi:PREDICTED: uncharacterized protein LOC109132431 [Camelina sativa]|uniref:Uncharacterized protein LOC109132431 n=1 Tax=Camelina sativa TaxID=90675 RepID=A0ABM1RKP7_CAMSA|nr:PREDICTED: uncharacterized protein LOC109132431 [Camelina sativa]